MSNLPMSAKCIKYLLFIFNLLFVITGVILISVGATIHGIYGNYYQFVDSGGYISTSAFLIAIGVIIFIISFFGCCGAVKENFCMTITFTTLLIIVFIFELSAGISGYVLRDNAKEVLKHNMDVMMSTFHENQENGKALSYVQSTFRCCGGTNYTDWYTYLNNTLPISCCDTSLAVNNFTCLPGMKEFYERGCLDAFGDFIKGHAVTIGGVALGIAFIQLIGVIFSCHLSKQIKQYSTV